MAGSRLTVTWVVFGALCAACATASRATVPVNRPAVAESIAASPQEGACTPANLDAPSSDPQELLDRGAAHRAAGSLDSAFAYFGAALQLRDTSQARELCLLLQRSPLLRGRRSVSADATFVRDVRQLVRATPAGEAGARQIASAEEAMEVLEAMLTHRKADIEVQASRPGIRVEFRRWFHRNDPVAQWEVVYSDTTVRRPAVSYQFRYRTSASQDTVITLPCANGCRMLIP